MFLFTYVQSGPQRQLNFLLENLCTIEDSFAYICMHKLINKAIFFPHYTYQLQCFPLTPSHTPSQSQQLHDSLMFLIQVPRYQMETFHLTLGVPRSQTLWTLSSCVSLYLFHSTTEEATLMMAERFNVSLNGIRHCTYQTFFGLRRA